MNVLLFFAAMQISTPDSTRLTLIDAVNRALKSYPTVAVARAQRDRASADLGDARANWLPRLWLDASLMRFQEPMVVQPLHGLGPGVTPLFDRTLIQAGVSLGYTLFDFGTRSARVRAQRAMEGAADAALSNAELMLAARVVNAYLRVLTARALLIAQDQQLARLNSEADRVQKLLAEGKAARIESLRVDAEAKRAKADRIAGESQLDVAEHDLAQLADLPWESIHGGALQSVRLADTTLTVDAGTATRAALVQRAHDNAPESLELRSRAVAVRASLSAAKATRLPEFRLTSAYIDRGRAWADFAAEWQVGVAVSYPLFTGGSRTSAIHRADADARTVDAQQKAVELGVDQGVDRTLAALRESHARVAALESAAEQSAEVVRIERLSLEVGSGTQSDYLEAEANLLRARAGLIEARHAEVSARVELARILGEITPEWLARTVESQP
ncbi:MAG: TolC family protein [Gemmatimonadetes bacterium]|nr:TolC family protein [Gemmatimonadota bacterium]